jgi:restriction system protein
MYTSTFLRELIAELLASYGWTVDLTKQTRDGGYDIFALRKDALGVQSSWLIECKRDHSLRNVSLISAALSGDLDID